MSKQHWISLILTALACFCLFLLIESHNESRVNASPQLVDIEVAQKEQKLNVAVMVFTEEDAQSLLTRLQKEREEAEKARAAAEAARRVANATYSPSYFKRAGRIWWGGWSWTYYSERILPGYGLRIPGRHTDSLGYVRDGNGYLCLASDVLRKGTVIETPFGSYGKVYDCGCGNNYTVDVYVGW